MARKRIDPEIKKVVKSYIELLKEDKFPIESVFVFGSRVSGKARNDSDIDVAVVSPKFRNNLSSTRYLLKKAHQLQYESLYIEPHGFYTKEFVEENPFAWEIMEKGVRVK